MNNRRQIFLFGAGAVIDWKGPKTNDITYFICHNKSVFTLKNSDKLITEFIYQKLINAGYSKDEINFETIINVIEELIVYYSDFNFKKQTPSLLKVFLSENDLCNIFNYSIEGGKQEHLYKLQIPVGKTYNYAKTSYNNENPNQFFLQHLLASILTDINNRVANYSWNTDTHSNTIKDSKNSLNFRKWIKNISDNNIIRLYSLNYDNLFNSLIIEDEIDCFDGFVNNYTKDDFAIADIYRIVTDTNSTIHYNLHGSSYWNVLSPLSYNILNPVIVKLKGIHLSLSDNVSVFQMEKGKTIIISNIITGYQKAQKSALTPFRQMQSAFDRDCITANKITIVGYSFGDEHINEAIKIALMNNKDIEIEIINPDFINKEMDLLFSSRIYPIGNKIDYNKNKKNIYSYFDGKMKVFTMKFSEYLKFVK